MRGHQDHVDGRIELHDPFQHFQAAHARHHQIGQHDLWTVLMNQIDAGLRIGRGQDLDAVLRERARQHFQAAGVIVDNQE